MHSQYFPVYNWLGKNELDFSKDLPCVVDIEEAEPPLQVKPNNILEYSQLLLEQPLKIEISAAAFPAPAKVSQGLKGLIKNRFGHAGEDAFSITPIVSSKSMTAQKQNNPNNLTIENSSFIVCALADGVSAWRKQGIDAGEYSKSLVLQVQKQLLEIGDSKLNPDKDFRPNPKNLLRIAAEYLTNQKILGSCTACVCCVDGETGELKVANVGDSGVCVLRRGRVIFKSAEQEHAFGYPFQLPSDSADSAIDYSVTLFDGDVIVIGSDGVFDNLSELELEGIIRDSVEFAPVQGSTVLLDSQEIVKTKRSSPKSVAQSICFRAFNNSVDKNKLTPYSKVSFALSF